MADAATRKADGIQAQDRLGVVVIDRKQAAKFTFGGGRILRGLQPEAPVARCPTTNFQKTGNGTVVFARGQELSSKNSG